MKILLILGFIAAISTFDFTIILASVTLIAFILASKDMKTSKSKTIDYL